MQYTLFHKSIYQLHLQITDVKIILNICLTNVYDLYMWIDMNLHLHGFQYSRLKMRWTSKLLINEMEWTIYLNEYQISQILYQ